MEGTRGSREARHCAACPNARYYRSVYTECVVTVVTVPLTLLSLLERQPSHSYDLKRDYDANFGRRKPLPFGQVDATLARLARDGKVSAADTEPGSGPDRKRYVITDEGVTDVAAWLAEAVPGAASAVCLVRQSRAGTDVSPLGRALSRHPAPLTCTNARADRTEATGSIIDALLADYGLFHLEADLRWIELTASRLDALAKELVL
jgi:DNA-binding PadR family transcriptional regulator